MKKIPLAKYQGIFLYRWGEDDFGRIAARMLYHEILLINKSFS